MNIRSEIKLTVLFMILAAFAFADDSQLQIGGQIRHRMESDGKDFSSATETTNTNLLRSRLHLKFTTTTGDLAFIQLQDSRNFGTETNTLSDGSADNLDLHQAYFQLNNIADLPLQLKVGRMEMIYANQRLIGAVGWHNIGRAFDGVLARYSSEKFSVDGFAVTEMAAGSETLTTLSVDTLTWTVSESASAMATAPKVFRGLWLSSKLDIAGGPTQLHAYFLNNSNDDGAALDMTTMGIFSKGRYPLGGMTLTQEIDFAIQTGTLGETTDISASLLGVRVGLALPGMPFSPAVGIGFDQVSGDDPATADKYEAFSTLYATNHKYYGAMDYFLDIPKHTSNAGLQDIIVQASIAPRSNIKITGDFHQFSTLQDVDGHTGIGSEIDLAVIYNYRPGTKIVGGFSQFTPGSVFEQWKGNDPATWAYLMTIFNF